MILIVFDDFHEFNSIIHRFGFEDFLFLNLFFNICAFFHISFSRKMSIAFFSYIRLEHFLIEFVSFVFFIYSLLDSFQLLEHRDPLNSFLLIYIYIYINIVGNGPLNSFLLTYLLQIFFIDFFSYVMLRSFRKSLFKLWIPGPSGLDFRNQWI